MSSEHDNDQKQQNGAEYLKKNLAIEINDKEFSHESEKSSEVPEENRIQNSNDIVSGFVSQDVYDFDNLKNDDRTQSFDSSVNDIRSLSFNSFDSSICDIRTLFSENYVNDVRSHRFIDFDSSMSDIRTISSSSFVNDISSHGLIGINNSINDSTNQSFSECGEYENQRKKQNCQDLSESVNSCSDLSHSLIPEASEKIKLNKSFEQTVSCSRQVLNNFDMFERTITVSQVLKKFSAILFTALFIFVIFTFVEGFNIFVCFSFCVFFDILGPKLETLFKKIN